MGEEVEVSLGGKKLFEYLSICLFTHRRLIHHFDRGTKVKKLPHKFTEIICIVLSVYDHYSHSLRAGEEGVECGAYVAL